MTRTRTFPEMRRCAPPPEVAAYGLAKTRRFEGAPGAGGHRVEAHRRVAQRGRVAALGRRRALEDRRQIIGSSLQDLLEGLLRFGVVGSAAFDFLGERMRAQSCGIQVNRAPKVSVPAPSGRATSRAGLRKRAGRSRPAAGQPPGRSVRLPRRIRRAADAQVRGSPAAGSPGANDAAFANSRFASSSRPTWSCARPR